MAIRHLRDVVREIGSLYLYAACSVAGAIYQPEHQVMGSGRAVVLVPGFLGRGLAFFRLRQWLVEQGYPVYIADLGFGVGCIREKSRELECFVDTHELEDFYIVGHSMGGLISLGMEEEARRRVRHFITLGTAYHGAVLSHLVPVFPAARQLNPRSPLVRELIRRARQQENLTTVVARWDEIAFPRQSCLLDGSCETITGVAGHAQLILNSKSLRQVTGLLSELEANSLGMTGPTEVDHTGSHVELPLSS